MSNKDLAWEAIFESLNIQRQLDEVGVASVTAEQIKNITRQIHGLGQQEPRIITKFDTREQRATILRRNDCTILATSNGTYSLIRGDGYHNAEEIAEAQTFTSEFITSLETLPSVCTSESQVIDTACASGLLGQFLGEDSLPLTIRGRLRSGVFDFTFNELNVHVDGVQVEVDAGYDGKRIYILEAKMGTRDNFITRQLYYPYRMWDARGVAKEIVPIFLSYSDGVFSIYEYSFAEHTEYNSIHLTKSGSFILQDKNANQPSFELAQYGSRKQLLKINPAPNEPDVPFPQADDLRRVIDTIFAVSSGCTSKSAIADYYDFNTRQSDYYGNAARYLGFLELDNGNFALTDEGRIFASSTKDERRLLMLQAIMKSPTLNQAVHDMIQIGAIPDQMRLALIISNNRGEINNTTAERRAHTVHNWLQWVLRKTQ